MEPMEPIEPFKRAVNALAGARRIVVLTGAGVSTDSGIPDFRSPTGLWTRYDPRMLAYPRYVRDPAVRRLAWQLRRELHLLDARPNPAHLACVRLAERGLLAGVVTQNIDGLHTDAGLDPRLVCEVHGTARFIVCLSCGDRTSMASAIQRLDGGEEDPPCVRCGGILKADTVSFGQSLPPTVWARAVALTEGCDGFVAAGSSLVVYPVAELPLVAREAGAPVVIINRESTPLDAVADAVCNGEVGALLPALVDALPA
jgi:NAD-dependent deacetylase